MHTFACPVCNSSSYRLLGTYLADFEIFLNKHIVKCLKCNLVSVFPMPSIDDLNTYYNSYWKKQNNLNKIFTFFKPQALSRYHFIERFLPKVFEFDVIDIGAGFGLIAEFLKNNFSNKRFNYDAVEIDPIAIQYLKDKIRPRSISSNWDNNNHKYHLIILSHILEHLTNPLTFLKDQIKKIDQNGIIFIEVPNQDYLYKARNEPHLIFFDENSLSIALNLVGLEVLQINTCGPTLDELMKSKTLLNLKRFLKKFLPNNLARLLTNYSIRQSIKSDTSSLNQYGPNRRWIRAIAQIKKMESPY